MGQAFGIHVGATDSSLATAGDNGLPRVIDVLTLSIGSGAFKEDHQYVAENILSIGEPLLAEATVAYGTATDDQPSIVIDLFESVSHTRRVPASEGPDGTPRPTDPKLQVRKLGAVHISLPPGIGAGTSIEVSYRASVVGLEVSARRLDTDEPVACSLTWAHAIDTVDPPEPGGACQDESASTARAKKASEALDFFELTGLSFDPPEANAVKVREALAATLKDLARLRGVTPSLTERDDLERKIASLMAKADELIDANQRTSAYRGLAQAATASRMARLAGVARLLAQAGYRSLPPDMVSFERRRTGLTSEHVELAFREAGLTLAAASADALPHFPVNADRIASDLAALRAIKDLRAGEADPTQVTDLYALAAYLEGDPKPETYHVMTTPELARLFDRHARTYAERHDPLGLVCCSTIAAAKAWVFDSEEHRQAYDLHLRYRGPELAELFAALVDVPPAYLYDDRFALSCVRRIAEALGVSQAAALAVYNREAGLRLSPYRPPDERM